jgi:hypothetical protein
LSPVHATALPVGRSAGQIGVLDSDVVASDVDGRPSFGFARLHLSRWAKPGSAAVHLWAFDHLAFKAVTFDCCR